MSDAVDALDSPLPPAAEEKDEGAKTAPGRDGKEIVRMGHNVDLLDRYPDLGFDEKGFPRRPPSVKRGGKWKMTELQRKVRFCLIFGCTFGNVADACSEAGVKREEFEVWVKEDAAFAQRLVLVKAEMRDLLRTRLAQAAGLVPTPPGLVLHTPTLQFFAKALNVDADGAAAAPEEGVEGTTKVGGGLSVELDVPGKSGTS